MRAKEYLSQLGRLDRAVHNRMKQLADMKADVEYIKGMSYDSVRVQTSPSKDGQALKQVAQIADLEAEIEQEVAAYHVLRHEIIKQIEQIPDLKYQQLLTMRYVDGLSLQQIADKMGYTHDWVRHLHGWALLLFEAKNQNNTTKNTYKNK